MAYKITDFDGTTVAPGGAYPYGALLDGGTRVNAKANNDIQIFFQRLADRAGVTLNSLAENGTNGYQFHEALDTLINPDFTSTGIVLGGSGSYTTTDKGSPYYNAAFKIDGNMVELCGGINVSIPGGGTYTLLTLPVAARPTHTAVLNPRYTITNVSSSFTINSSGELQFSASGTTSGDIFLDGLRFRLS